MNKSHILWGCLSLLTLTSCFKDEAPNAECDIVQAWIHADDPSAMFYQASDSLVYVISDKTDIRFTVRRKADITALAPHFAITPGAVMTPARALSSIASPLRMVPGTATTRCLSSLSPRP